MDDSEGFGSSGRIVDFEIISQSGVFGVPIQVISVTRLRRAERKELLLRLRTELERVQLFCKNIVSRAGVVHEYGDEVKKIVRVDKLGKKRVSSLGQSSGGALLTRDGSGRFESKQAALMNSTSHAMIMKQCASLLQRLMTHQNGRLFNTPVDVVKFNIPDYFNVIKHPMDLGTVQKKIISGVYMSPLEFYADVKLTFSNAMTYNPPGNEVHNMAATLAKYFELRWKSIGKKLPSADSKSVPKKLSDPEEAETLKVAPLAKKRKVSSMESKVKSDPIKRVMTHEDKHKLSRDLASLVEDIPLHIIDFLREHSSNQTQTGEDEIEIDIDDFTNDALLKLRKLVDDHLMEMQMNQKKTEPCEMEILNDSGLSNLSVQPCRGNDTVDEDVDTGGNDPPVSSCPPVEIEKDAAHKKNKRSCSSSSSSGSGSSSSDSGSGGSSENESDGTKVLSPAARVKETVGAGEVLDQKASDLIDPNDGNQAVSGLDQLEQTSQPRTVSTEADSCQEGEITPSERQASPDKLYRAALLRSRFADTILKAREKTLAQGEKGDPEKLRREREKLERQQREVKARLLAEAKAAEDALRQAEVESAVEAKKKRELEREAARQALLKMEKSVEINENSQFLEALELLTVAPADNIPSSVDETSPIHSEDGMGGFKLQGCTNPLEQLGLYMKEDEEEEEECEPNSFQDPLTDVEEGEID
ncbi:hypothetical protein IFM89_032816 [Coptis chinensis]|uniref:Uncharacterized protein n=1 Tax=Coptis chinensis TaxID=261450 RepID=A0A835LTM0_9MAGN|nr:hypothetical protein IFM89_032816 [Coptis chinensis]